MKDVLCTAKVSYLLSNVVLWLGHDPIIIAGG